MEIHCTVEGNNGNSGVAMAKAIRLAAIPMTEVFFEPTDRRKAIKPFLRKHQISIATPNYVELVAIAQALKPDLVTSTTQPKDTKEIIKLCTIVSEYVNYIIVTLGKDGVLIMKHDNGNLKSRLYSVNNIENIKNVSGAGDCFASGFIHYLLLGYDEEDCVAMGTYSAQQALYADTTVPTNLNKYVIAGKSKYKNLL